MRTLGLDTSNYTTSAAVFDGAQGQNCSRLLGVAPGQLGLRQSDALFAHTRQLPERFAALFDAVGHDEPICAVGASTRPRAVEGSYMPCFLAGETLGRCIASVLDVPFYAVSHQQGHIAAALWSAGRLDLMQTPHLAWHLSGGTTELLLVTPEGKNVRAERIGGTSDLSAGQVMDRTGKLLGLPFPSGKALDELSGGSDCKDLFRVKLDGLQFSLSGLENKIAQFHGQGHGDAGDGTGLRAVQSHERHYARRDEPARRHVSGQHGGDERRRLDGEQHDQHERGSRRENAGGDAEEMGGKKGTHPP